MDGMRAFYHFFSIILLLQGATCQSWSPSVSSCPTIDNSSAPDNLHLNIFHEVTTHYPEILRQLTMAPFVNGMDPNLPAFEFAGLGSGFLLPNLSSAIRKASCLHREVTFSGYVYIRNSQSDGPLLELAYSSGLEAGRPIYIINMDAAANEITVAFRHGGRLYSEAIPVRLISGKWRKYMVVLSGNQLSFYFDCELQMQRLIPLPDYCYDHSPIVVSVLNSVYDGVEYVGHSGLMVYVQSLSVEFGQGGSKRVCPTIEARCPSCGQFLTYLERLTETQEKVRLLEAELARLQEMGVVNRSAVCYEMVDSTQQMFSHGEFLTVSASKICYCDNGTSICTNTTDGGELCVTTEAATVSTPPPTMRDPTSADSSLFCAPVNSRRLMENESVGSFVDSDNPTCNVVTCVRDPNLGLIVKRSPHSCDRSVYGACPSSLSLLQREVASCCGICTDCDYAECGLNEVCRLSESATCRCSTGFARNSSGDCVDIDECLTTTCMDHSECLNSIGSFFCKCDPGYERRVINGGEVACVDINECRMNTHNCSSNSDCENLEGSYTCNCHANYVAGPYLGQCIPTCTPNCINGGTCVSPNNCSCTPEYKGNVCQSDVDECSTPGKCEGGQNCVNTVGGYFCRCAKGYAWDGSQCTDIDECVLGIDNCKGTASKCFNTKGGFTCFCTDLGEGEKECTGSCIRKGMRILDTKFMLDRCRNCTCLSGETSCVPVTCDCAKPLEGCCQQECNRRDCTHVYNGETLLVRPGSTWINPSNRCERFDCSQELKLTRVNVSSNCPVLNCPEQTVPMGKCCPVCLLPRCDAAVEGQTVSVHNGCRVYTCTSSNWVLTVNHMCPSAPTCDPEDIVFFKDGCCPVCRQDVLGSSQTQCS